MIVTVTKNSILLIDDEADITFTIKSILEDNGFKVDSFTDPISALDNYQINFLWFDNSWYKDAKNGWIPIIY